jgi:cytochrome P450
VLDITRQNNKHLSFGQGIHYCVGSPLARMEGHIAFTTLFSRMPNLHLKTPREELPYRPNPYLRGMKNIPVAF